MHLLSGERGSAWETCCFVNVENFHKIFAYLHWILRLPPRLNSSLEMLPGPISPGHTWLGSERSHSLDPGDIWISPKGQHPHAQLSWDQCRTTSSLPSPSHCGNQGHLSKKKPHCYNWHLQKHMKVDVNFPLMCLEGPNPYKAQLDHKRQANL